MREIKFRAYDHINNEVISPDRLMIKHNNTYLNESLISDNNITLMQFTGFQDSEGTDIYEDDIVYVAGFGKAKAIMMFAFGSEFELPIGCQRSMIDAAAENDIGKILGNIYQNGELMGGVYDYHKQT